MFNISTIQNCLTTLVGFSQTFRTDTDRLDSDLVTSLAASYIDQSSHPLITAENITTVMETFRKTEVRAYSADVTYAVGELVLSANVVYRCIQAGINHTPASSPTFWTATNLLSAYLRRVREKACSNLFESVFSQRKLYEVGKTILTDTSLYEGTGSLTQTITPFSRFVYYEIRPKYKDTKMIIPSIGLQFNAAAPDLKIYVFQNSSLAPVAERTVQHTAVTTFQWHTFDTPIELYFNSDTIDDAGVFYIGYFQDDLPEGCKAIWKEMTFNGCSSCNGVNSALYRRWSNFFDIQPGYVENTFLNGTNMWEMDKNMYLLNQNWGMNLKMQVHCDVSDFICRNKFAFTKALKTQIVHDLLNEMAYGTRDNQKAGSLSQRAFYALETKENQDPGYQRMLSHEIKNVNFDISNFSSVCLPCVKGATGVKTKSAFK